MSEKTDPASDIVTVACFLAFHDDGDIWGGYKKEEAFSAFCRLIGVDEAKLMEICRPV